MTRIANFENLIALPRQAIQHVMMSYMSSQNERDSLSIQDQIFSTLPVREPIRSISTNINHRKQFDPPIDWFLAKRVRRNWRCFHNCNDNQNFQSKNLINCYRSNVFNSD